MSCTEICAQADKSGIEGNPPPVYVARPIEEIMQEAIKARRKEVENEVNEPEEEKYVSEHSFMWFILKVNMSKGALRRTYTVEL